MKPVIRHGVFETNSSSSHSLCIADGKLDEMEDLKGKPVYITTGEFGWEVDYHYDFGTKAAYLYTHTMIGRRIDEELSLDDEVLPESLWNDQIRMIERVVREHTGCSIVNFVVNKNEYYKFGYIDHQSVGVANEAFMSDDHMKSFLFNRNSFVETDNDNY